jgi:hypothetical protein
MSEKNIGSGWNDARREAMRARIRAEKLKREQEKKPDEFLGYD